MCAGKNRTQENTGINLDNSLDFDLETEFTLLCDIHYYSHCHTKQYSDYTTNYTKQHNTLTTHFALSFFKEFEAFWSIWSPGFKNRHAQTRSLHIPSQTVFAEPRPLWNGRLLQPLTLRLRVCGRGLIQRWRQKVGAAFVLNFFCACELEPQTGSTGSTGASSESVCPRCV